MNEDLRQQLIEDLLIESIEGLDEFDQLMLRLEKGDGDGDTMNRAFRVIHTIKGTGGCIGLSKIESLSHSGENLLSQLRAGRLQIDPEMISTLLSLSDGLRDMLGQLERDGTEGDNDYSALAALFGRPLPHFYPLFTSSSPRGRTSPKARSIGSDACANWSTRWATMPPSSAYGLSDGITGWTLICRLPCAKPAGSLAP